VDAAGGSDSGDDELDGEDAVDKADLLSSAVVLGVSAIRPNAKPEISIAAPMTMANILCDLVMSYPPLPLHEANKWRADISVANRAPQSTP
jgi:hypothetical protein